MALLWKLANSRVEVERGVVSRPKREGSRMIASRKRGSPESVETKDVGGSSTTAKKPVFSWTPLWGKEGGSSAGRDRAAEGDVCVWPPVLVGRSVHESVEENGARKVFDSLTLKFIGRFGFRREEWESITIDAVSCAHGPNQNRPLYVFPPDAQGYLWARYLDKEWTKIQPSKFQTFEGWSLSYATVRDMTEIDPSRKLVKWIPLCSSAEHDGLDHAESSPLQPALELAKQITSTESGEVVENPQLRSPLIRNEDLRARLRDMKDAELSLQKCVEEGKDANYFISELESLLQDGFLKRIKKYMMEGTIRESQLRELFAFDSGHIAKASTGRLISLGAMGSGGGEAPENVAHLFTSRMKMRGVEVELSTLQSIVDEIRRAITFEQKFGELKEDQLESTRKLVKKQEIEWMEHVVKIRTESEKVLEERMLSRLELVKSVRSNEEDVSALREFLSLKMIEIAQQVYQDALSDTDQKLQIAVEVHKTQLVSLNDKVSSLSSSLQKLKEANSNGQECCICLGVFEELSVSSGSGQSSRSKKQCQRACFMPCMHANVCSPCAIKRWQEGPRVCPICKAKLVEKPRVIYF